MSKAQCVLKHNRNLSTSYKGANYEYDRVRSMATAKQIKFYRSLWYKFKDNGIDINTELDKRGIEHSVLQHPSGRCGYSDAIDLMIDILTEHGLYEQSDKKKAEKSKFINTYTAVCDSGGGITRTWEKIEYREENDNERKQ